MRPLATRSISALACSLLCAAFVGTAVSAPGELISHTKISQPTLTPVGVTLQDGDEFGDNVCGLGDLDGAGPSVGALAVGAINDNDGGSNRGAVYILYLNPNGTVLSDVKISNTVGGFTGVIDNGDEFGGAVCNLGDLDGSGPAVRTIAVGANRDDDGGLDRGAVWILSLNAAGGVLSHTKISSTLGLSALTDTDGWGEKIIDLGDLDGAGPSVRAIASSAVSDDDGGNDRGAVYVVFLDSAGGVVSYQKISNTAGNFTGLIMNDDGFGSGLAPLGDLDGNGPSAGSMAVGLANADGPSPGFDRGVVYILLLDSTGNCLSHTEINHETGTMAGQIDDTDSFGSSMDAAGDIDGPGGGANTLIVGVGLDDDGGVNRGAAYLIKIDGSAPVGVGDPPIAEGIGVSQVRPNPFSGGTTVAFRLTGSSRVQIDVLDLGGRRVRRLVDGTSGAGEHRVTWDGRDDAGRPLATGAYLVRMALDGRALPGVAKAILLR